MVQPNLTLEPLLNDPNKKGEVKNEDLLLLTFSV